jgi:hypothetical protein
MGLLDKVMKGAADKLAQKAAGGGGEAAPAEAPPASQDPVHLRGAAQATSLTGDTPHDESDPDFAPIEGIGLEKYAELAVAMQGMDEPGMKAYAEANGVKAGTWGSVRDGWNQRFETKVPVMMRWGQLYRQKLAASGVERPDITFEQYATITAKRDTGTTLDEIYEEYGLTVSTWALVSDHWVGQLAADPQLTTRFEDLVKAERARIQGGR